MTDSAEIAPVDDGRRFGPNARCTVCSVSIAGEPIRHFGARRGAGSTWGPSCEKHENWHPAPDADRSGHYVKGIDS